MSATQSHKVPEELGDNRLDRVVRELFETPWSKARKWIENGKISLDGHVVTALDALASAGQTVLYTEDAPRRARGEAFDPKCVVHLDNHILVANKPPGILTVPYHGDEETFDQQLRTYLTRKAPKPKKKKGALASLMVVHRLDKGTSGLLVFARTWTAKEALAVQFRDHSLFREYVALVHGIVKSTTITSHLLPDRGDGMRGSREQSPNPKLRRSGKGQRAITHIEHVKTQGGISQIQCRLETGRTNQIRIHLAEFGHPLLGETTYMRGFKGVEIKAPRLMLHAAHLGFIHPVTGEEMSFHAAPPSDFKNMMRAANGMTG